MRSEVTNGANNTKRPASWPAVALASSPPWSSASFSGRHVDSAGRRPVAVAVELESAGHRPVDVVLN